jgi:Secretion system C-terminal sorting domain
LYLTGEASAGSGSKIFVARLDVWGFISEYVYTNPAYALGGKGLGIAAEGNSVYVAGALRAQPTKPFKTTVIKMDTALTTPAWVNISKSSVWPLGLGLSSTDVIYTVDFALQVVGFSKSTGNQLFAKNDFKSYAQVYNQPITTAVLNNNQLLLQASVGVKVNGNATINKVTAKYSTSGMKVYQQLESLSLISPGNPGSAEALGMAYSPAANYTVEVYRKTSSAGNLFYVNGKTSPTSLRIAREETEADAELLSVFPNPAAERFTIRSTGNIASWTLYDMTMRKAASGEQAGKELVVDCRNFCAGMYFLSIDTDDGVTITRKVMIR